MAQDEFTARTLRPEDVTSHGLPVTVRGYDRDKVDRLLARVAEEYATTRLQNTALREQLRSLEAEVAAAEAEAAASARAVAELMRGPSTQANQPTRSDTDDFDGRQELARQERDRALTELTAESERVSELQARLREIDTPPAEPQAPAPVRATESDAAELLIAATRAAEDVRQAARARALRTLTKARELSALVHAQTEREQTELVELETRREQAQQELDESVTRAHAAAARFAAHAENERNRVRDLLTGMLTSLDAELDQIPPGDLLADLGARLEEKTNPTPA